MTSSYLKTGFLILVGIAALFAVVHFGARGLLPSIAGKVPTDAALAPQDTQLIGERAPYFDLPNVSGDHVKLSDYADQPLVIVFWSTWNADAADQIKILDDYLGKKGLEEQFASVVAINSQEERSIVASFMRRGGYQVNTVVDARGIISEAYRVKSLPTFFFIDRGGIVRETYSGLLNRKMVVDKIEGIL